MTDSWLVFDPVFPLPVVLIASITMAVVFAWLEWKKNSRYKWIRCFAQIIMMAALVALILRPAIRKVYPGKDIILLTPNFQKEQADSLTKLFPSALVRRTDGTARYDGAVVVSSGHTLLDQLSDIRFVLGSGLPNSVLDENDGSSFTFLPGKVPGGITSIHVIDEPVVNHRVTLNGIINTEKKPTWIVLESPGGIEDSTLINAEGSAPFELSFIPKQVGKFVYSIILKDQQGTVMEKQPLPLDVKPEKKLRLLILQDYPTAEIRYLKNFLSGQFHSVTLRYQLSKNIFRYEYANAEQKKTDRIDSRLLQGFDVLFIDSDVLQNLNGVERKQLIESIRYGLGVVVLFNDLPSRIKSIRDLSKSEFIPLKKDTVNVAIRGHGWVNVSTWSESIKEADELQPLILSTDKRIFSGYTSNRLGKVGFQLLTETYRFIIEGKTELYSALWSPLLENLARSKQQQFNFRILSPAPIYPNEPVDIEIISSEGRPTLYSDDTRVPLTEDVGIDNRWLGKVWFEDTGWHNLIVPEDSTNTSIYVHQTEDWKSLRVANQHRRNGVEHNFGLQKSSQVNVVYEPIPRWIFFSLFLCTAGFLWLAAKL